MIWILLLFTYIIPTILTVAVFYHKSDKVTRGDLVEMVLISLIPLFNFLAGYIGGLVVLCESQSVNKFFNTRIK
jgi:hypothetical protein